jgi:hypothetical protein
VTGVVGGGDTTITNLPLGTESPLYPGAAHVERGQRADHVGRLELIGPATPAARRPGTDRR